MGKAFEEFLGEIEKEIIIEDIACSICLTIKESFTSRDVTLGEPMVRDDNENFGLMQSLGLVDLVRSTRSIGGRISAMPTDPVHWFLSQKAIDYHERWVAEGEYENLVRKEIKYLTS